MKKVIISIFLILALMSTVLADDKTANVQELNSRYTHLSCRVNLMDAQASILAGYGNVSTDKIKADLTGIKSYADANDAANFNDAVKTLNTDAVVVNSEIKAARQAFSKANITADQRTSAKASWSSAVSDFSSCNMNAQKDIVDKRVAILQKDIDRWNGIIANMTAKGLDTTQMQSVVSDAEKTLQALKDASSATNDSEFKSMLSDANDQRLHVWARFAISRIKSYADNRSSMAMAANLSDKITQIDSTLNSAETLASPGKKYGPGEFEQVWQDIKNADSTLKDVSTGIRQYEMERRTMARELRNETRAGRNFTRGNGTGFRRAPPQDAGVAQ